MKSVTVSYFLRMIVFYVVGMLLVIESTLNLEWG